MANIKLISVEKIFDGKEILDGIDLEIEEGTLMSLLGPSGCGKTTTLKLIAGLMHPDGGDIEFDGSSVLDIGTEARGAIIVFQDHLLFPHMTVEKNIDFGLKMAKKSKGYRAEKISEMIELVKLQGLEKKYPAEISGGQKQRVAIARALAVEPKVLLLDEPFSNLDTKLKEEMRVLVSGIQKRLNITTVLVTHDKEDAMSMSDSVAIMMDGKLLQVGSPRELYEHPSSPKVANFFGDTNYVDGICRDGIVETELGRFSSNSPDGDVRIMIRPEDIHISEIGDSSCTGTVAWKKYAGERIYYRVKIGELELKLLSDKRAECEVGDSISIKIDRDRAIVYRGDIR